MVNTLMRSAYVALPRPARKVLRFALPKFKLMKSNRQKRAQLSDEEMARFAEAIFFARPY